MVFEILDARFRCVFFSREAARLIGISADEVRTPVRPVADRAQPQGGRPDRACHRGERRRLVAAQRTDHAPVPGTGRPGLRRRFRADGRGRGGTRPRRGAAPAWHDIVSFPEDLALPPVRCSATRTRLQVRINDDAGRFIGVLYIYRGTVPESLLHRLGRGDPRLFERMDRVSEPGRRPAGILFADLEASGALSRRLSSRGYFDLIRDVTDLIDSSVVARDGIVGKHAGDGGSALFLAADFDGSESAAARAAIEAARAIRDGAEHLGPDDVTVKLNIGVHWGATLMVGQVATSGRLEVTALGDQMNEGARIEAAARERRDPRVQGPHRATRRGRRAGDRPRPGRDRLHAARRGGGRERQGDPRRRGDSPSPRSDRLGAARDHAGPRPRPPPQRGGPYRPIHSPQRKPVASAAARAGSSAGPGAARGR